MALFQGFIQPRLGQGEFVIAGREFLQAFQVGAQRVRLLYHLLFIFAVVVLIENSAKIVAQLRGDHVQQFLLGDLFDLLVFVGDLRIVVLDRRWHVAGDHFAGVVVHRQQRNAVGVEVAVEFAVFDHRQRVGDKSHLQTVFGNVLGTHVAHQRPAVDQFQAGQMGEEMALAHGALFNGK